MIAFAQSVGCRLARMGHVLLCLHAARPGRTARRGRRLRRRPADGRSAFDRSVDVLIGRLRAKVEPDRTVPQLIKTVRGGGYMLAAPVRSMVTCGVLPSLAMLRQQAAS